MRQETIYRAITEEDVEPLLDLWLETWGGADRDFARWEIKADPLYLTHTLVAQVPDGRILASAHYGLNRVWLVGGEPVLAGCLSHVATHPDARRQGHAERLVRMAHDGMQAESCRFSLLFSSEEGQPLYRKLGYTALSMPYRRGIVIGSASPSDEYTVQSCDPAGEECWRAVRAIWERYYAERPMCVARDEVQWNVVTTRTRYSFTGHTPRIYLASRGDGVEPVAYMLAHISDEASAREHFGLDRRFSISEVGALPGHERAFHNLLAALTSEVGQGRVGGNIFMPFEPTADEVVRAVFGDSPQHLDDRNPMGLPLDSSITADDLLATANAPGAHFNRMDEF
jgi:ribosomal protein S18 acetylase RimI-like enzyme